MNFAVAVFGDPITTLAPHCAAAFVKAALSRGHRIQSVFFYHDAVSLAWADTQDPEIALLVVKWVNLRSEGVELNVCIGAAERRGFAPISSDSAIKNRPPLIPCFEPTGLGQLINAIVSADRFVTFVD